MTTFLVVLSYVFLVAILVFSFAVMIWDIRQRRAKQKLRRIWPHFALSIVFAGLFLASFVAHAFAEWGTYAQDQREHGEKATLAGYATEFSENTLQNWQSEFLQNMTFIVFAAFLIHRGSAESKDGEEQIQAALERIERRIDEGARAS
jgi:uncharacterized membrane protein YsdA (DUF1294 family)